VGGSADPLSQVNPTGTVNALTDLNLAGSQMLSGGAVAAAPLSNAGGEMYLPNKTLYFSLIYF
jgi:hypothetical protein